MAQHLETMQVTDPGEQGVSSPGLLSIAWRHKTLVVFGVAVALVLGALYFVQAAPLYESEAQVLVVKKRPDVLPVAGNGLGATPSEDFIPTHQGILKSALIVNDAVQKAKLHSLDSFKDTKRVTERILKRLKANRSGKSVRSSATISPLSPRGLTARAMTTNSLAAASSIRGHSTISKR